MRLKKIYLLVVSNALASTSLCMELSLSEGNYHNVQQESALYENSIEMSNSYTEEVRVLHKLKTKKWLEKVIQPLNNGRYHPLHKGAQANCTLIAEKCVRVLAGLEQPELVPVKREDVDITFREDEEGSVTY